jgi:hypothetical protein
MRQIKVSLFVTCLSLIVGCGGSGNSPTGPGTSPNPSTEPSSPPVNSYVLTGYSPAAGTVLKMGDAISVSGIYTVAKEDYARGYAYIREDGAGYITTIVNWTDQKPPLKLSTTMGLDPRNSFHDFAKGHVIDILFVLGDSRMMGPFGVLDRNYVVFSQEIKTQYPVI